MAESRTKTRELLEQLATTEYRRSMRAEQIFRTLRDEPRREDGAERVSKHEKV